MDERLEALERLARLRDSGLLSASELAVEKERILRAADVSAQQTPIFTPSPREGGAKTRNFLRKHRWPLAAAAAALGLAALLVYLTVSLPLALNGNKATGSQPDVSEAGREIPEGTVDLSALLAGEPSGCGFGDELRAALRNVAPPLQPGDAIRVGAIDVPGFPEPLVPRVRRVAGNQPSGQATIVELPAIGVWRGLMVNRVRTVSWADARTSSVQIRFSERPIRVLQMLNGAGFGLPAVGQLKQVDVEGRSTAIGVEAVPGGAALVCAQDTSAASADGPPANST